MTATASPTTCPLCGARFDPSAATCPSGCPMARGCTLVCCPNCGYGFPREGKVSALLRRLLGSRAATGKEPS